MYTSVLLHPLLPSDSVLAGVREKKEGKKKKERTGFYLPFPATTCNGAEGKKKGERLPTLPYFFYNTGMVRGKRKRGGKKGKGARSCSITPLLELPDGTASSENGHARNREKKERKKTLLLPNLRSEGKEGKRLLHLLTRPRTAAQVR